MGVTRHLTNGRIRSPNYVSVGARTFCPHLLPFQGTVAPLSSYALAPDPAYELDTGLRTVAIVHFQSRNSQTSLPSSCGEITEFASWTPSLAMIRRDFTPLRRSCSCSRQPWLGGIAGSLTP